MKCTTTWRLVLPLALVLVSCAHVATAETRLLRYPDIHGETLVFCYGGDLYTASTTGSDVTQITDYPGEEKLPKFSPDGREIAFTAEFEGDPDVYVVSVDGGEPRRLTYHAAQDLVVDWHPDGTRVLFRSNRSSFSYRFRRLFEVSTDGGLPVLLEIPEAESTSYDDSGDRVAFCRTSTETLPWKGYRGGGVPRIWTYDFADGKAELVIDDPSINHHPLWMGEKIYFVSDRGESREQNLWVYDTSNRSTRQITTYHEWSVCAPSLGGGRIVYEKAGRLHIYDAATDGITPVEIEIALPEDHWLEEKNVSGQIGIPALSPDGKTLILYARGDLYLHDPETNDTRNLTQTSNANERSAVWRPDGKAFAYLSDVSGEEQIYVRTMDADSRPEMIGRRETSRLGGLRWSPDGTKIGYADKKARYHYIDIESNETTQVLFDEYLGGDRFTSAVWSPDSRWLAYSLGNPNRSRSIFLYCLDTGEQHRVTDASATAFEPQFDPAGRYLYWVSDCQVNVRHSYGDGDHHRVNPSRIIVATLQKDAFSPFAPGLDEETANDSPVRFPLPIDLVGLGDRITSLPIEPSHYSSLQARENALLYRSEPDEGDSSFQLFDLETGTESEILQGAWYCRPAEQSEKMVYLVGRSIGVASIETDCNVDDGLIDVTGLTQRIDLRQEWRQIFHEAWRIQRDFFFDETLHGVDWPAMNEKYAALLPHVAFRTDLNHLIEQLFSELGHSHVEIYGGDFPEIPGVNSGVLGVDLSWDAVNRQYRITKILRGQNWDPDRTSPLLLPGMNVQEGDYLLAIDDTPLTENISPYAHLQDKAGAVVSVTVNDRPTTDGARTFSVRPAAFSQDSENFLRYNEWVRDNAEKVARASDGRIGYIHIADTYLAGIEAFLRNYYVQLDKEALILDVRFNSGGYPPFWMIERLNRQPVFNTVVPHGKALFPEPDPGMFGPKVCLINEWAESGGDIYAEYFRVTETGPLIGRTTAGNLSASQGFRVMDGGVVVYASKGIRNDAGEDVIENVGIAPDIVAENNPSRLAKGHDDQLQRAVSELMKQL